MSLVSNFGVGALMETIEGTRDILLRNELMERLLQL